MTYEEIKRRKQGYKVALDDIRSFGVDHCKLAFALRLKCTGCDPCWTVGYGEALVDASRSAKAKEVGEVNTNQDDEDEEWGIKPWEYVIRRN